MPRIMINDPAVCYMFLHLGFKHLVHSIENIEKNTEKKNISVCGLITFLLNMTIAYCKNEIQNVLTLNDLTNKNYC